MSILRTIEKLYVKGKKVNVGTDESPAIVWVQKYSQHEYADILTRANNAVKLERMKYSEDSVWYQDAIASLRSTDTDSIIEMIIGAKQRDIMTDAVNDLRVEDFWQENFDLLTSLDATHDQLSGEDKENHRKLQDRWEEELRKYLVKGEEDLKISLNFLPRTELIERALKEEIEANVNVKWYSALQSSIILSTTYECQAEGDDHDACKHTPVFSALHEVVKLPDEPLQALFRAIHEVNAYESEAKN